SCRGSRVAALNRCQLIVLVLVSTKRSQKLAQQRSLHSLVTRLKFERALFHSRLPSTVFCLAPFRAARTRLFACFISGSRHHHLEFGRLCTIGMEACAAA